MCRIIWEQMGVLNNGTKGVFDDTNEVDLGGFWDRDLVCQTLF